MIRAALLTAVALAAAACSMLSLGYKHLPDVASLWLQRQVPLDSAQQLTLEQDLGQLLAWHRQNQLLPTADLLRRWQGLTAAEPSADALCREFDAVRALILTVSDQAAPALARLARGLDPRQLQALASTQRERHAEFREAHLSLPPRRTWLGSAQAQEGTSALPSATSATASQKRRLDDASDRYARLYGRLNGAQQAALRESMAQSAFDAPRLLAERERRTQDLLASIAAIQASTSEAQATQLARGWLHRLQHSPTPGYPAHAQELTREACEQLATVHRLATPEQRQRTVSTLAGYENELRQLASR
jgi:hypothetical protein